MNRIFKQKTIKLMCPKGCTLGGKSQSRLIKENIELNKLLNPIRTIKRELNREIGFKLFK